MKNIINNHFLNVVTAATILACRTHGQGGFQNLDFESATPPFVVIDPTYNVVAISNSIPGWTAYIGVNPNIAVLHNNYFLGTPAIAILGPGWTNQPAIIQGDYSVLLQGGAYPTTGRASAALAQTGIVPADARSVQFKAGGGAPAFAIGLFVGGQSVPLFTLDISANYVLYGGDISQFAGQVEELRIAALATDIYPFPNVLLDSIEFSNLAVPEPGTIGLFSLGAVAVCWRFLRKGRTAIAM